MSEESNKMLEIKTLKIEPGEFQLILGQAHFIKTIEDIHETLVNCVPSIKFGLAFASPADPAL